MKKNLNIVTLLIILFIGRAAIAQPFTVPVCAPASNQLANPQISSAQQLTGMITNTQYTVEFRAQNAGDDTAPAKTLRIIVSIDDSKVKWGNPILVDGGGVWELSTDPNEITSDAILLYNTGGAIPDGSAIDIKFNIIPLVVGTSQYNTNIDRVAPSCVGDVDASALNNGKSENLTTTTVLPVKLTYFAVTKEGSSTKLTWTTTEESKSDFFEVQHSHDAKNWAVLGTIKSHGESAVLQNYSYSHTTPSNGTNYYRLRMVDKDGTFAYSGIRSIDFEGSAGSVMSVFPNPASDRLFVNNIVINKLKTISILSQNGNELISSPVSASGINIKGLQPGLYVVKLLNLDGTLSTHKLIIAK